MTSAASPVDKFLRYRRHRTIVIAFHIGGAVVSGLWYVQSQIHLSPRLYFGGGIAASTVALLAGSRVMIPFLVSCWFALQSISSRYRDLLLMCATVVAGTGAICTSLSMSEPQGLGALELIQLNVIVAGAMMAVPHYLTDGLEE